MNISKSQLEILKDYRAKTTNRKEYLKTSVIIGLASGYSTEAIGDILGVSISSVKRYRKCYKDGSLKGLLQCNYEGRSALLTDEQESILSAELNEHLYVSTQEIQSYIEEQFAVIYSLSGVQQLLKRLGFVYKKTKQVPGKADKTAQEKKIRSLKRLHKRLKEEEGLYFIDGTHPTHNTSPCYGWIKKGEIYPQASNTGRKRVNINGVIDIQDKSKVYVDYTDSVNAQSTIRLLEQVLADNPEKKKFYIVSDNAAYYRSKVLKAWLKDHKKVKWIYLPPYSPNLNLIERLWGYMKKKIINGYYHETYAEFKETIESFFENIKDYQEDLNSMLTFKFQRLPI